MEPNSIRRKYLNDKCNVIAVEKVDQFFSIVVDAVGFTQTRELSSAKVSPGGVITHIGLGEDTGGIDVRRITLQEINFIGTYTYTAGDFKNTKKLPYILSGGLNVTNIKKAISLTGADFVDINSGVEEQPGEKSLTLIDGIISSIYN